ncbi:phosphoribosylglycinamide formyltransferase [Solilutibacter silvestris]|uniref:Phosphoribosylglycinamide formyltransferase n=1 Tax=Solilutibacter silvestris TaxID=1645665 RepID=A0A2K1Q2Y8_9GAMM|nr:phosphoribosylglycinamide formyltransferase [Lysobacter silvestris]PNS09383.1 PurN: phosphoribosylglycinamide formyltransferase [Lysobacter silvestris]
MSGVQASPLPRLAVLCSGRGSNLDAILSAISAGTLDAEVVGVFSDKPACTALQHVAPELRWSAKPGDFPNRASFEQAMGDAIAAARPDWIVCAGYMRILGNAFVERFRGRMLNVHPSLLPRHRGLDTHRHALEAGDREHGASIHFVIPELDAGAVIAQVAVPMQATDTPQTLAARVLVQEHLLLPEVLRWAVAGRLHERDSTAILDGHTLFTPRRLEFAE